MKKFAQTR